MKSEAKPIVPTSSVIPAIAAFEAKFRKRRRSGWKNQARGAKIKERRPLTKVHLERRGRRQGGRTRHPKVAPDTASQVTASGEAKPRVFSPKKVTAAIPLRQAEARKDLNNPLVCFRISMTDRYPNAYRSMVRRREPLSKRTRAVGDE